MFSDSFEEYYGEKIKHIVKLAGFVSVGLTLTFLGLGILIGSSIVETALRKEAIKMGVAYYSTSPAGDPVFKYITE